MHNARRAGKWFSGSNLAFFTRNVTFSGFNQDIRTDAQGSGQTKYVILDTDGWGTQLYRCFQVDMTLDMVLFAGKSINFPAGSPPPSDSSCWFDPNAICTGGTTDTHKFLHILHSFSFERETDIWLLKVFYFSLKVTHISLNLYICVYVVIVTLAVVYKAF